MSDYTGLYLTILEPLTILFRVIILGVATGAISLFLTKSTLLNGFHTWLENRLPFLEEMLSCPWCTSHWVALIFTLIYRPLLLDWTNRPVWEVYSPVNWILTPIDYLVTILVMVAVAMVTGRMVYSAIKSFAV